MDQNLIVLPFTCGRNKLKLLEPGWPHQNPKISFWRVMNKWKNNNTSQTMSVFHFRFVQTHEIWTKDDSNPRHQVKYDTSQLTDSLVCVSMSNEIRRTIASLTQVGNGHHAMRVDLSVENSDDENRFIPNLRIRQLYYSINLSTTHLAIKTDCTFSQPFRSSIPNSQY